jgi:hypothetical protein
MMTLNQYQQLLRLVPGHVQVPPDLSQAKNLQKREVCLADLPAAWVV